MGISRGDIHDGVRGAEYDDRDCRDAGMCPKLSQELVTSPTAKMPIQQNDGRQEPEACAMDEESKSGLCILLDKEGNLELSTDQGFTEQFALT